MARRPPRRIGFSDWSGPPEGGTGFEDIAAVWAAVRAAYGGRCAFTGSSDTVEPFPIVSREMGGRAEIGNFVLATPEAGAAFIAGHLAVGASAQLLVDLSRIDPELLERLDPLGILALPDDRSMRPDEDALAWHRDNVFGQ